ncbi:MAG: tetratricopeptide repeat protein [bacterium]|nr:tetratricopeptide repeat protein [bacterium]
MPRGRQAASRRDRHPGDRRTRTEPPPSAERGSIFDRPDFWIGLGVAIIALTVRIWFLCEHSQNPSFHIPLVDSGQYHAVAKGLVEGEGLGPGFFWQPIFYPMALSAVYWLAGPSVLCARIAQLLLGAITCVLTLRLGQRAFGRATGIIAGLITALYGPLVFYECELVGAGWAAFWSVVILLGLLWAGQRPSPWRCGLLGVCGALCVVTRPAFLPFVVAAGIWLGIVSARRSTGLTVVKRLTALALGLLIVTAPVSLAQRRVIGHLGFLPTSGGLNLYIGNNAARCDTLTIRPGPEWMRLVRWPNREGRTNQLAAARFFYGKVWAFALDDPLRFIGDMAHKGAQMLNGRELPRNLDLYTFHEWSKLLRGLAWKHGGFGFPWGVLLPLAVAGLILHWRRAPAPLLLFVILYPLAVVMVFVAGRYRVPVVPALAVLAAAACTGFVDLLRTGKWRRVAFIGSVALSIGVATSLPGPACEERIDYSAELYVLLGDTTAQSGDLQAAEGYYRKALDSSPESPRAHNHLGVVLGKRGDLEAALAEFAEALRGDLTARLRANVHYNRGNAHDAAGDSAQALGDYNACLELDPEFAPALCRRGTTHHVLGQLEQARADWQRALEVSVTAATAEYARKRLGQP